MLPNRWLPRNGEPATRMERVVHRTIRFLAFLPIYTAIIVTLTLLLIVFGTPFIGGR